MAAGRRQKLPARVLEQARRLAETAEERPVRPESPEPPAPRPAAVKKKLVAALKRFHPMD